MNTATLPQRSPELMVLRHYAWSGSAGYKRTGGGTETTTNIVLDEVLPRKLELGQSSDRSFEQIVLPPGWWNSEGIRSKGTSSSQALQRVLPTGFRPASPADRFKGVVALAVVGSYSQRYRYLLAKVSTTSILTSTSRRCISYLNSAGLQPGPGPAGTWLAISAGTQPPQPQWVTHPLLRSH